MKIVNPFGDFTIHNCSVHRSNIYYGNRSRVNGITLRISNSVLERSSVAVSIISSMFWGKYPVMIPSLPSVIVVEKSHIDRSIISTVCSRRYNNGGKFRRLLVACSSSETYIISSIICSQIRRLYLNKGAHAK